MSPPSSTVSLSEVARKSQVSMSTASRVLNNFTRGFSVRDEVRERVLKAARELNYRPSGAARVIAQQKKSHIGVLTANATSDGSRYTNLTAYEMILGLTEVLAQQGFLLSVIHIEAARGNFTKQSRVFSEKWLDGMVVIGPTPNGLVDAIPELVEGVVWLDSDYWEDKTSIRRDEIYAGNKICEQVIECGYNKVVWIGSTNLSSSHYSAAERLKGVSSVCREHGVEFEQMDCMPWNDHVGVSRELISKIGPEVAVITSDFLVARWVSGVASEANISSPHDFGLASCDDSREVRVSWPQLSCMSFDRYDLGAKAGEMMANMLQGDDCITESMKIQSDMHMGSTLTYQS